MATSNKDMSDLLRKGRDDLAGLTAYTGPPSDAETEAPVEEPSTSKYTVVGPGEPPSTDQFEYEPMLDMPGAWVVYPPGVPCDDTEYRVQMSTPAGPDDFAGMQQALEDAGATNSTPNVGADIGGSGSTGLGLESTGSTGV